MLKKETKSEMIKDSPITTKEAVNIIAIAVKEATVIVATAAREAKELIASDVRDATKLLASNAAEAVKVRDVNGTNDHDLLIELGTYMKLLREDINKLKDGNVSVKSFDDLNKEFHERNEKQDDRINALEHKTANYALTLILYSIGVASMIALIIFHILKG